MAKTKLRKRPRVAVPSETEESDGDDSITTEANVSY